MTPRVRVRFITADGFVSSGIRWVTNSLWSHVEFGTPIGTWIGAHADGGWMERPANYCTPTREAMYDIPCTQEIMDAHLKRIRAMVGQMPYNKLDIVGLLIKNRKLSTPHALICSQGATEELIMRFGSARVLNVLMGFEYLITPETLHLSPIFVGRRVFQL